ncbi:ABC transporter ATP-binding protein [Actinoplanes sp. LDG1-06]|uniref:ABC transporter ATP-binding protein n=1 Tax=Paractinoplanes ovalisporus TaxID=2810368 RepID=A0ABS2AKM2_9ACTN|nr:ABC transporter ATP-binding protein [Actinoplanes ovalisporus]MBM2620385.1 ABC transporter ATP-binding protein [Actinoplanes ovalisporus]
MTTAPAIIADARGSALSIFRRGITLSPHFLSGIGWTLTLGLVAMAGRVIVPVTIQRGIDHGIAAPGGVDVGMVTTIVIVAIVAAAVTATAAYALSLRLYHATEAGLADTRIRAFRHAHDLSLVHQQAEHRGVLVSRVTSDIDTVTSFLQYRGLRFAVSLVQLVVTTIVMAFYSWQLTLVVLTLFLPLIVFLRWAQARMAPLFSAVREGVGRLVGTTAEGLVGASVVRAYAIEDRTIARTDTIIEENRRLHMRAHRINTATFGVGEAIPGLVNVALIGIGFWLIGDGLTVGEFVAVLFLAAFFVTPMQIGVAAVGDIQQAVAGWRRVLGILDATPDVVDPGPSGRTLPDGAPSIRFENVGFAYPGGKQVLHDVNVTIPAGRRIAVVGETGSGKTTFALLATRLLDPGSGQVLLGDVPIREVRFQSLRRQVVMVPQEGFLFGGTIADNIRYGAPDVSDAEVETAMEELGLGGWLATLPAGLTTEVGQRGESLSVGERQLVALARAYLAHPDVLVFDEATSAVDPATEVCLQQALNRLTRGRTAIFIAHRLATAETADEILVFSQGRLSERGSHAELLAADGQYTALHSSWTSARDSI